MITAALSAPAWVLWLATPVVATVLAALWVWFRGWQARPRRLDAPDAIRAHRAYLDALATPVRDADRPSSAG